MKKTENYAMPYPEQDDYFNVEDFQNMMVSVDNLMKKLSDSGAQISSDAEHLYNQTKAQMDNIQKRMNAFTALRDGSTTGDAELKDIRVAYDGKEYGNAGEAVREQASDIHKALFGAGASIWSKAKYVNRGCAEYVEHLGTHENPKGQGWASGQNYGQKIINILNSILSIKTEKENDTMNINTSFISNNNSYAGQTPVYIVIHNTDNYAQGANAKAHAKAQHDGNFKGYSAHVFVDDTEAYQALPYDRGAWHVGVNYGGRLFGTVNNRNAVGIEMCVQEGYNYEKAFQNTVQICKQIMKQLGIPADRVVQHYDVCAKNCPSAIRAKCDWNRFKQLIGAKTTTATVDKYYHTRKSWADSKSQIGAYKSLENAKKEWKEGYTIYDWNGKAVYPVEKTSAITLTKEIKVQLPVIKKGSSGAAVSSLQAVLGVEVDGSFGNDTETSLKVFQKNVAITADGSCGTDTWTKVFEHMKANTK